MQESFGDEMTRILDSDQLNELEKRLIAAEAEQAIQQGKRQVVSGPAMQAIEFNAIDYLRRCVDTIKVMNERSKPNRGLSGPFA